MVPANRVHRPCLGCDIWIPQLPKVMHQSSKARHLFSRLGPWIYQELLGGVSPKWQASAPAEGQGTL